MPAYGNERFQPLPPLRTATSSSQKSHWSGTASPEMTSPTSPCSRSTRTPTSPAEDSFFSALSAKIRSRSRSRGDPSQRSKSPRALPPQSISSTPATHPTTPTYATQQRPQQPRHKSSQSQGSIAQKPAPARRSTSSSSDMWRGRHSNSWLFNDFSFTETGRKAFSRKSS